MVSVPRVAQETVDPVSVAQLLNGRYRIIEKLGSGRYSTVWLAKDQIELSYKAIKILDQDCYGGEHDIFELEILERLRDGNPLHPGYQHVSILLDKFLYNGHVCLVMEPLAEDMKAFSFFFPGVKIDNPVIKRIMRQLLFALDYAHTLGIIHTDIKQDNIMVKITRPSVIDEYLKFHALSLGEYNFDSSADFLNVHVVLGDWGSASWETKHLSELIQPTLLRAPEVILQAPWGKEVDIWNLGALLPELVDAVRMFNGRAHVTGGVYLTKHHIEEMDVLFGPFPAGLIKDGNPEVVQQLFDADFRIRDPTERPPVKLEMWIECLKGEELARVLSMLRAMLTIDPKQRPTARELQDEPWLSS